MSEFKVGYTKPPKEHQFKPKNQTAARRNRERQKENGPDVAALLDKPLKVKRGGKSVRMHPHEAAMSNAILRDCLRPSTCSKTAAYSRYRQVLNPPSFE